MRRNEGQLFRLHGSTDMRVESRVRVGGRSGWSGCGRSSIEIELFFHGEMYGLKRTMELGFLQLNGVWREVACARCCAMRRCSRNDNKF